MSAELFDDQSPFVLMDNRTTRPVLPTTADLLNRRHSSMLPQEIVEGKTILDIGCALAATGKWVLDRGAAHYVGVEPQQGYADIATGLLGDYEAAEIVCERGLDFFARCKTQYDIVGLLGVLHGQYNPLLFIEAACAFAKDYVCIENLGNDRHGPSMVPVLSTWMPIASSPAGSRGFGWTMSPSATQIVMEHFGFAPDMPMTVMDPSEFSTRYAWRFKRVGKRGQTAGDFMNTVEWKEFTVPPMFR